MGYGDYMWAALTVLHLLNSPPRTFSASITIRPAITALVVAMAGMILPAIAGEKVSDSSCNTNYTHSQSSHI